MNVPQCVFDGAPDWVKWAVITKNGEVILVDQKPIIYRHQQSEHWSPFTRQTMVLNGWRLPSDDWQNSATMRAVPVEEYLLTFFGVPSRYPITYGQGGDVIIQYHDEVFVWFDEVGLMGGVEYSFDAAQNAKRRYGESLDKPKALLTQNVFSGCAPHIVCAYVDTDGRTYLSMLPPTLNEAGTAWITHGWNLRVDLPLLDATNWRESVIKRDLQPMAPAELEKLAVQDARHNAAQMVDAGRLTLEQFNEIYPE